MKELNIKEQSVNDYPQLLMIDDDLTVMESFKLWLEGEGYLLHTARSKDEAIEMLQKYPIAVCLIDLKMEEMGGIEMAKQLTTFDSLLKIIIITGYPSYETAIDAIKVGIFDYASKASENTDILKKIQEAISSRKKAIASKTEQVTEKTGIILVCHHAMIKEGFDTFCRDYKDYQLAHTYHSVDYIKPGDFNSKTPLVMICNTCSPKLLQKPGEHLTNMRILFPRSSLVMFNCDPSEDTKKRLIKLGIKGFLPKNISKESMEKAFDTILSGQIWVSRKVAHELLNELLEKTSEHNYIKPQNPYHLSNREIEILQAIASGLTNAEISNKLFISEKTVKAHINHLFKKMSVKSRTKAVKIAVQEHII